MLVSVSYGSPMNRGCESLSRWLLLGLLFLSHAASAGNLTGRVVKIPDGDTLTILDAGKRQHKIRLADIDAPETKQPFGSRSKQFLSDLCFDKTRRPRIWGLTASGRERTLRVRAPSRT